MDPTSLPPVPAKLATPMAPPANTSRPAVLHRAAAGVMAGPQFVFDTAPPTTLAARSAAEKARASLQAALRSLDTAQKAVAELTALTAKDNTASAIAEHEGVGNSVIAKFSKHADPLVAAFTLTPAAAA